MAYSLDLREKVINAIKRNKMTYAEVQEIFNVSYTFIYNLEKRFDETGSIEPKPHAGGMPPKIAGKKLEKLKEFVIKNPDATLEEMREHLKTNASIMAVSRSLDKLGFTRKKNRYGQWNKIEKM
jgi:transposase